MPNILKQLDNLINRGKLLQCAQEYLRMASDNGEVIDINWQMRDLQQKQREQEAHQKLLTKMQDDHKEREIQLQLKQYQQEQLLQEKQYELELLFSQMQHQLQEKHRQQEEQQRVLDTEEQLLSLSKEKLSRANKSSSLPQPIYDIEHLKHAVSSLDWSTTPRLSRDGSKQIELQTKRKEPCETLRGSLLDFVQRVMQHSNLKGAVDRDEVLRLCAKILFYDFGYKEVKGISNMYKTWDKRVQQSHQCGSDLHPLRSKVHGYPAYTVQLEKDHPGYIRDLFRYAQKTIGYQASFEELARTMNEKSKTYSDKSDTKFNRMNLYRWFAQEGGKLKSPKEKPYLTDDQKQNRKEWCEEEKLRMREWGTNFYCCFLDEKWFYVTSRRRRLKVLPPSPDENADEVAPHIPTAISRRHPNKVSEMFVFKLNKKLLQRRASAYLHLL